jgi:hypothetical protein
MSRLPIQGVCISVVPFAGFDLRSEPLAYWAQRPICNGMPPFKQFKEVCFAHSSNPKAKAPGFLGIHLYKEMFI